MYLALVWCEPRYQLLPRVFHGAQHSILRMRSLASVPFRCSSQVLWAFGRIESPPCNGSSQACVGAAMLGSTAIRCVAPMPPRTSADVSMPSLSSQLTYVVRGADA